MLLSWYIRVCQICFRDFNLDVPNNNILHSRRNFLLSSSSTRSIWLLFCLSTRLSADMHIPMVTNALFLRILVWTSFTRDVYNSVLKLLNKAIFRRSGKRNSEIKKWEGSEHINALKTINIHSKKGGKGLCMEHRHTKSLYPLEFVWCVPCDSPFIITSEW